MYVSFKHHARRSRAEQDQRWKIRPFRNFTTGLSKAVVNAAKLFRLVRKGQRCVAVVDTGGDRAVGLNIW